MLDSFHTSSASEPYVATFSPLEHAQQEVRQPTLLPPSESDSTGNPHSPISTAGKPAVPPAADQDESSAPAKRKRRAWAPNADDHLIYRMVRLDGSGQDFVAECFGIHQSTVSRIVRRYERWEAHAAARDDGRLDPAERLRSQRWLAAERNEAMLTSCLRLAGEMERCKELSKSVTRYPLRKPNQETEVRNESAVLDRTGMAARFLRLAFRINMEQVKLAEADPAPLPKPLTEEEIDQQEAQAAEERAEIAAVRERCKQNIEDTERSIMDQLQAAQYEAAQARADAAAAREEAEGARRQLEEARCQTSAESRPQTPSGASGGEDAGLRSAGLPDESRLHGEVECDAAPSRREGATGGVTVHKMHNLHTEKGAESAVSAYSSEVCIAPAAEREFAAPSVHGLPNRCLDDDPIVAATCHHDAVGACADSSLPMLARTTAGP